MRHCNNRNLKSKVVQCVLKKILIISFLLQSACSNSSLSFMNIGERARSPNWHNFSILAADDVNFNSAISVDLIFILDPAMLSILNSTSSNKWFSNKTEIMNLSPSSLKVLHYEMVPHQAIQISVNEFNKLKVWAAYMYVDYKIQGDFRKRLNVDSENIFIQLNKNEFQEKEIHSKFNQ